jgi:hypothetical protein
MVLIGRILATIMALILFSLAVFVALASLQYESILSDLTRQRLVVLADSVRDPFQSVANLGVPIDTVRNADAVLERARLSDEAIVTIQVFTPDGEIVRSTAVQHDAQITADVLDTAHGSGESATWHAETASSFLVGANVASLTGDYLGSVVIEYSKQETSVHVRAMEARLVILAGSVFAVSTLIMLIVLRLVLAEHLRIFDGILSTFDRFERRFWRGEGAKRRAEDDFTGLGFSTANFRQLLEQSEAQYQQMKMKVPAPPNGGAE